jgi:His-Xaa-Ser system protein HxsD
MSVDRAERSVSFSVPTKIYSQDAVRIAAHVFSNRVETYHEAGKTAHELTLVAKRRDLDEKTLEALGGEFLNEMLNQEYRFVVARFNRKVADLIAAQTLLSARGGENPAVPAADSAELKAETARLMAEAEAEIKRTMPKKLSPQGPLYPPYEPEVHAR